MQNLKKQDKQKPAVYVFKDGKWVNVTQTGRPRFFNPRTGKWE